MSTKEQKSSGSEELAGLLGVTPEVASEDACKVEHDLSEETFRCIQQYLEKMMEEQKED